jgi:phage baseplate assembly protein W
MAKDYIGVAIAKPLLINNGAVSTVAGSTVIEQSIADILNTPVGSKFYLREYGSRIRELVFEPNDFVLRDLLTEYIREAIDNWEPRCTFYDIDFEQEDDVMNCFISVVEVQTNSILSFVYPFSREIKY